MTESEALELVEAAAGNALAGFAVYLTVVFAYLATAYFVGQSLKTRQVVMASALFVFGGLSCTAATCITLGRLASYASAALRIESAAVQAPGWALNNSAFWVNYLFIVCVAGILLGLYFMWDVRHPKVE